MHKLDSPDSICEKYADLGARITVKSLEDDCILVEGSALDLEFLGELLLTQARYQKDCGFEISPSGPGQALFADGSTLGIYIHRTDGCPKQAAPSGPHK